MPVTIDTSNLNGFCRQIAAMPAVGKSAWDVMLFEVGKILENCVRLTTRTNVERIKRSVEAKNRTLQAGKGSPIIYLTKSGVAWFADQPGPGYEGVAQGRKTGSGKTFHPMTEFFRYGQPRWLRYQQFLIDLKNKQIDARAVIGRAGQTWVQMGRDAGIELQGIPGYIRDAPPFRGNRKVHGYATKRTTASSMLLELVNQNQIFFGTMDGNRILQTSINGRYKYFQQSMRRGVFDDVKQIAARYRGLIAA